MIYKTREFSIYSENRQTRPVWLRREFYYLSRLSSQIKEVCSALLGVREIRHKTPIRETPGYFSPQLSRKHFLVKLVFFH